MTISQAKDWVNKIYKEKARNDSNSADLANSLNIMSKTVLGDVGRLVYELMQNADDAPSASRKPDVAVTIQLTSNYLLFAHTGAHFTQEDVAGISGVGNKASQKDKDIQKVGYKGIGFKSVFGCSDQVQIISTPFCFSFDKNHAAWKGDEKYPWQVIPIWTNTFICGNEIEINPQQVNTLLHIRDPFTLKKQIEAVLVDCQIMLFLKHIGSITFKWNNNTLLHIEKKVAKDQVKLYKDGILQSQWLVQDFVVPVSPRTKDQLQQLSDTECPKKLKEATHTRLTFAARLQNGSIERLKGIPLYCYLPTQVNKNFPFVINADFITNAERTGLLDNVWNNFLFEQIAHKKFEWLSLLAKSSFKYQVPQLIKPTFITTQTQELAYNNGFEAAIKIHSFLLSTTQTLLKAGTAIVDQTGISQVVDATFLARLLHASSQIIDPKTENKEVLIEIGLQQLNIQQLCTLLPRFHTGKAEEAARMNSKIIKFFFAQTIYSGKAEWLPLISKTPYLLDDAKQLRTPGDIYFPQTGQQFIDKAFLSLFFLHTKVFDSCRNDQPLLEWLRNQGVQEPTYLDILHKSVFPLINGDNITSVNVLPITRFLLDVYKKGILSDKDTATLRSMKFATSNGLQRASDCYLPDKLQPEVSLQTILGKANYIDLQHLEIGETIEDCKNFFLRAGVQQHIKIRVEKEKIERKELQRRFPYTADYIEYLDDNDAYPSRTSYYINSGQHSLQGFVTTDQVTHLQEYAFAVLFWKSAMKDWEALKSACNGTQYHTAMGPKPVLSFLQFYVKYHPSIPCTDGQCRPSLDLYAPNLRSLAGKHFPVADIDTGNKEHAEFFGFRRQLSAADCLTLLTTLENTDIDTDLHKHLKSLYEYLIEAAETSDVEPLINQWKKKGKLLANNNTFQPVTNLYFFSAPDLSAQVKSPFFLKIPSSLSSEESIRLCKLFDIPEITKKDLHFSPVEPTEDPEFMDELLKKASFIAAIWEQQHQERFEDILNRLTVKIKATLFYTARSLQLSYANQDGATIYKTSHQAWHISNSTTFYSAGNWHKPLTLYALSNLLCNYLEIPGMERELVMLLQTPGEDLKEWLQEKGIHIDIETEDAFKIQNNGTTEDLIEQILIDDTDETEPMIIMETSFEEEVPVRDIDYEEMQVITKNAENTNIRVETQSSIIQNQQVRTDIGRWCEELVWTYLQKNIHVYSNIVWLNEIEENYQPYDFEIVKDGATQYIEVKGTPSAGKSIVYMSPAEWMFMFEHAENYSIFRIFNAGKPEAHIDIHLHPAEKIKNGQLMPNKILLEL